VLKWAVIFLIIALVAALFGFTKVAGGAWLVARILFFVCLVLFLIALVFTLIYGGTLTFP